MTRSTFFFVLLCCALCYAADYQLNDALSAAIGTVNITTTYQHYFESAPSFYPPACATAWPTVSTGSDLDQVLKAKKLRLGYSQGGNTPFVIDSGSQLSGFDFELASLIVESLNTHYSSAVEIEWVPLPIPDGFFSGLSAGLNAGTVDAIMSGITANEERAAVVEFTCEYFPSAIGGLTTADFTTYASLNSAGVKVGYQTGTISAQLVLKLTEATAVAGSSTLEGFAMVENGTVDYFIMSQPQAIYLALNAENGNIVASPFLFPDTEFFMAMATPIPTVSEGPSSTPSTGTTPTKAPNAPLASSASRTGLFSFLF